MKIERGREPIACAEVQASAFKALASLALGLEHHDAAA